QRSNDGTTNDSDTSTMTPDNSGINENSGDDNGQVSSTSLQSEKGVAMTLTSPKSDDRATSPLSVAGTVPGSWSNEGQFTVRLLDAEGSTLAESAATLDGDWMLEDQVSF